jgi:hypothetical protein
MGISRPLRPLQNPQHAVECMSAQPGGSEPEHDVIRVGAAEAVVVPIGDYLRLRAIEKHASAEEIEQAEIEAASQAHERWVAAGRPGARSHDDVMSELLIPSGGWTPQARA